MAVLQNECYRLVTIGYLKKFIGQSGSTSSIQNNSGGYAIITRTDDAYCPTYAELTGGTIIQTWSQGGTPKSDRDGITVSSSAYLSGNYAPNQCVDRHDLGLSLTRIEPFSIKLGQYTFDACSGETNVSVSYSYIRTTKTMSGCPSEESDITYTITSTTIDAPCSELVINKTLSNTASTIDCSTYKMFPNNDGSERTDKITASVNFRGTTYSSSVTTNQPATEGGYTHKVSERDEAIDIINVTISPSANIEVTGTAEGGCTVNQPITLVGQGLYGHYVKYAYEKCGIVYTGDTVEIMVSTATTAIPSASDTLSGHNDVCCNGDTLLDSKTLTLSWSGKTVSRSFAAICKKCDCPEPVPEPTKCCQLNGPMSITCNGEAQFEVGECGCDNVIDLGLPSGTKWGKYPLGTDENYNSFVYYQWGYTDKWTTVGGNSHPRYDGAFDCVETATTNFDVDVDNCSPAEEHDAVKFNYPNSGYRMPTKNEAQELLDDTYTSKAWQADYNGKGVKGWLLTSKINGNELFIPAVGEFYPESDEGGRPWEDHTKNGATYVWTRTGLYENYNNYSGYRIFASANGSDNIRVVDSSPRYGNIVMPVCDKG